MSIIILLLVLIFTVPAHATDPQLQGEYQKWLVYNYEESNGPVCYAMTRAVATTDAKGKALKIKGRGQVLLQVTRRVSEGNGLVFSFVAGHSIKSKTEVSASIGKSHFRLRGDGDTAWSNDPAEDADMVKAMRGAKSIAVSHQDRKGNGVADSFSVKGAVPALAALDNCH